MEERVGVLEGGVGVPEGGVGVPSNQRCGVGVPEGGVKVPRLATTPLNENRWMVTSLLHRGTLPKRGVTVPGRRGYST